MSQTVETRTVRIPISFEKVFENQVRPLGLYSNYPDFVRSAIREKLTKVLKGGKKN